MSDQKRWHRTHQATEGQPMVGKLKGGEVIAFGFSLALALFLFKGLTGSLNVGLFKALICAAVVPMATLSVLVTLVIDKPGKNLWRFLEWCLVERSGKGLLLLPPTSSTNDEN